MIADEIAICGTLAELVPVKKIEEEELDPYGPVLTRIREKFFNTVRGKEAFPELEMSFVPKSMMKKINNAPVTIISSFNKSISGFLKNDFVLTLKFQKIGLTYLKI